MLRKLFSFPAKSSIWLSKTNFSTLYQYAIVLIRYRIREFEAKLGVDKEVLWNINSRIMVKISRQPLNSEDWALFLDDFWSAVASCETKQEVREFLFGLLTYTERKMFAKRFQIAMMLLLGYDYSSIVARVKVTASTISRVNNLLAEGPEGLKKVSWRIIKFKRDKLQNFSREAGGSKRKDLGIELAKLGVDLASRTIKRRRRHESIKK